jgi:hypothetical protein
MNDEIHFLQINNSAFQKRTFFDGKLSNFLLNFLSVMIDSDKKYYMGIPYLPAIKWLSGTAV